jgi:hypothetical protein
MKKRLGFCFSPTFRFKRTGFFDKIQFSLTLELTGYPPRDEIRQRDIKTGVV